MLEVWCSFSLFCCAEMPRNGSGAQCQKCPANTFNDVYSSRECTQCPAGSKSPEGSTSQDSCICDVGVLDNSSGSWSLALLQPCQLGKKRVWPCFPQKIVWFFQSGEVVKCSNVLYWSRALNLWIHSRTQNLEQRKCGCPKDEAKSSDICVKCHELFLNCTRPGAEVHSAGPLQNYTRLGTGRAYKCLTPASRCNADLSDALSQVKGLSNEGFRCQYLCFHVLMFHGQSGTFTYIYSIKCNTGTDYY